jgi:signal transduction histidine kinase
MGGYANLQQEETAAGEQISEKMLVNNTQALSVKTDIATLCEEVVEGAVAGKDHIVRDISALNSRPCSENASQHQALQSNLTKDLNRGVAIILDFEYQKDWHFVSQPGALRRILMNVLGNALKYTDFGFVKVCLRIERNQIDEADEHPTMISLSISDTGKGISRSFLRTRLFRPFNQEDHLSTGCGLGLSIVKSLVTTLNGTLEVQSELGVSTTDAL